MRLPGACAPFQSGFRPAPGTLQTKSHAFMEFFDASAWTPRATPLEAVGVVARGIAASELAHRLLDRSDSQLSELRGAASLPGAAAFLAVVGAFELLPWAGEAIYLGRDTAPALLFPIHLAPPQPPELLERALRRRFLSQTSPLAVLPLAVLPMWNLVLPLGEALPLRREFIQQWLESSKSGVKELQA